MGRVPRKVQRWRREKIQAQAEEESSDAEESEKGSYDGMNKPLLIVCGAAVLMVERSYCSEEARARPASSLVNLHSF